MSAWLNRKVDEQGRSTCPRCGAPSSETSMLCEQHRIDAAARQSRWQSRRRPTRRQNQRCAFCNTPSSTYRCELCKAKRLRWDASQPVNDLRPALSAPAQQELDFGAAPSRPSVAPDEES